MDTLTRLRTALAGRYEVEHELGRGGMAVVYLARDTRHERRVAIKVVLEDLGGGPEVTDRFLREIRTTAQLHHPHILPLYDSGEAGGLLYYVMPFVEGESLRERLEREGPLAVGEAVRIAREVADALAFAHERGVVHRDIKPENILLAAGHAAVADFGIARAADAAGLRLTQTGMAVGTPVYMSPEQATAGEVDGRADLYALGCVLYEMLAGRPPFAGPTAQAVMARHTTDPAAPLRTVRPEVPEALEAVVVRALAKLPVDRWATGRELADALEATVGRTGGRADRWRLVQVGGAAAVGLAIAAAAWLAVGGPRREHPGGAGAVQTVAVLPFTMSGDTAQAILAEGLTEGVTTGLVRVPGIGVEGSGRVRAYRDRSLDAQRVGEDLGVSAVVSAVVRVAGNRLRVTAQLTNVADGLVLWREQFDGDVVAGGQLQDVFTIQDAITERIVGALQVQLSSTDRAALARGVRTRDPEAYRLYLEGRREYYANWALGSPRAVALFEAAIARDSNYADAWAGLAAVVAVSTRGSAADADVATRRALERALALDPSNSFALITRGWQRALFEWDWDRAWLDFRQAVALAPASAEYAMDYSAFLLHALRPDSAVAWGRRAVTLMPGNPYAWMAYAHQLLLAGQPDSALAAADRAVAMDSTQNLLVVSLLANVRLGRRAAADSVAARELARSEDAAGGLVADRLSAVVGYYGVIGDTVRARGVLERMLAIARREHVSPTRLAIAFVAVGDRERALSAMEEAARERDPILPRHLWMFLRPLSGEPRYQAVWRRVYGERPLPRAFL
jgi:serine/threonine-protein kinase